jgi:hypothetical protein
VLDFVSKLNDSVHTGEVIFAGEGLLEAVINTKQFSRKVTAKFQRLVVLPYERIYQLFALRYFTLNVLQNFERINTRRVEVERNFIKQGDRQLE